MSTDPDVGGSYILGCDNFGDITAIESCAGGITSLVGNVPDTTRSIIANCRNSRKSKRYY